MATPPPAPSWTGSPTGAGKLPGAEDQQKGRDNHQQADAEADPDANPQPAQLFAGVLAGLMFFRFTHSLILGTKQRFAQPRATKKWRRLRGAKGKMEVFML